MSNLTSFFTSSSAACKINAYELWSSETSGAVVSTDTSVPWSYWISVDSATGKVSVNPQSVTGTKVSTVYEVYLVAKSVGGKQGIKKLNFNFTLVEVNKAP